MDNNRNSFLDAMGVLGTMLFGALIGAAVALLMAPKSGAELGEDLRAGAERMGEQVSDTTHKATESVRAQVEKLGEKAEELSKKAEELGSRLTKKVEDADEA